MTVVSAIVSTIVQPVISPVVVSSGAAPPAPDSLLTDLVAWWSLDEASGTRVNAHNPGTHDLTDNNTVGQTTGVVSNAASFVAASQEFLSVASHADLVMGDRDFSVCGWAKFDNLSASAAGIVAKGRRTSGANGWNVTRDGVTQQIQASARNTGDTARVTTASVSITYDTFFFFIMQFSTATDLLSLEVNRGTPVTASLVGGSYALDVDNLGIGSTTAVTECINGAADNVAIAHRIWTTDEKNRLYSSGAGMAYPG